MFFRVLTIGLSLLFWLKASFAANLLSSEEVIRGATDRIQKYRTTEVTLALVDNNGDPIPEGTPVEIEQVEHEFLFGCNLYPLGQFGDRWKNESYAHHWADLFNYATLPFYWWADNPERNRERIAWCQRYGIEMKGHPLAWNYQDPVWLPDNPSGAMDLQMKRIDEVLSQFGEDIPYWDVVNEPTKFDREDLPEGRRILTRAIHEMGRTNYLRRAFETARKAKPDGYFLVNDFVYEASYAEEVVAQLVDDSSKPLYDGIGIQAHQHTGAWEPRKIWLICEQYAHFPKPIHFTETTFVSGDRGWDLEKNIPGFDWTTTPEGEARQADEVEQFYTIAFSHPSVASISWWDLTDESAWMGAPGGLLRKDMTPKPAYDRLRNLIKVKWWTHLRTRTGPGGVVKFRCFYGKHEIRVGGGDERKVGWIRVRSNGE
ncbi:MAG: endo-1,4-beta-xylanase [Candidatus Omnitrophica bacterium]|nr:endo-1,4-beta-xylanase [Candidatus Omnitrophota bacterium]